MVVVCVWGGALEDCFHLRLLPLSLKGGPVDVQHFGIQELSQNLEL